MAQTIASGAAFWLDRPFFSPIHLSLMEALMI